MQTDFLKHRKVLNKGFIRLIDVMGSDKRIVESARVSFDNSKNDDFEKNKKLIDYLWRNEHTSPFETVSFQFHIKAPIFVFRQLQRYRTAKINEISGRYVKFNPEFYIPEQDRILKQSKNNKQGSSNEQLPNELKNYYFSKLDSILYESVALYNKMINHGMAKELARIHLPLNLYSEMYWKIDLRNLFHVIQQRTDSHAQFEIQQYAFAILDMIKEYVPIATEVFKKYQKQP